MSFRVYTGTYKDRVYR